MVSPARYGTGENAMFFPLWNGIAGAGTFRNKIEPELAFQSGPRGISEVRLMAVPAAFFELSIYMAT